ncbi:MAG: trypsin-like peptidase domain-containing protein, partial [Planctomycetota bacterium]
MSFFAKRQAAAAVGRGLTYALAAMVPLVAASAFAQPAATKSPPQLVDVLRPGIARAPISDAQRQQQFDQLARDVQSMDRLLGLVKRVVKLVTPSVVHIDIQRTTDQLPDHPQIPGAPSILISAQGSGVVVDKAGYILTTRHVIASSDEISVTLSDGRTLQGFVVGTDERTDLAVLKVDADDLIPIPWGDSDRLRVGSPVWAIGSPFGLDRTVTFGILSGKHRVVRAKDRFQDFMQSDVAVNPGNSGGPLVNSRGTLIGINTAIVGDTYQGVSFSIPSNVARKIYEELRRTGEFVRGWLGGCSGHPALNRYTNPPPPLAGCSPA